MNRHTDVSRARAAVTSTAETDARPGCAAAVDRAAVLLVHGIKDSEAPIAELGGALARMAQTLADNGAPLFGESAARPAGDFRLVREAFARDIAVCIRSLQFHDRVMQQLTKARDLLTGLAPEQLLARVAPEAAGEGSIELF